MPEMRQRGRARVDVDPGGSRTLAADRRLALPEQGGATLTVGELLARCPDVPPFREDKSPHDPACILLDHRDWVFELENHRHVDWRLVGGITLGIVFLMGVSAAASYVCSSSAEPC